MTTVDETLRLRDNKRKKEEGLGVDTYVLRNPTIPHVSSGARKRITIITALDAGEEIPYIYTRIRDLMADSVDHDEALNYYCSFLYYQLGRQRDDFVRALSNLDYNVELHPWRTSSFARLLGDLDEIEPMLESDVSVMVGLLLLFPFKNFSPRNYEKYMRARINTFGSKTGAQGELNFALPMSAEVGIRLSKTLSSKKAIRTFFIHVLMRSETRDMAGFRPVFSSVLGLITWNDLVAYVAIRDELLRSDSPLLNITGLYPEWGNFLNAIEILSRCDYPQFFSTLGEDEEQGALTRQMFPVLAAVALKSASNKMKTMGQFASIKSVNDDTVDMLLDTHLAATRYEADIMLQNARKAAPKTMTKTDHKALQTRALMDELERSRTTMPDRRERIQNQTQ